MTSQTPLETLEGVCVQLLMAGSIAHHGLRGGSSAFFLCWSLKLLESTLDSDDGCSRILQLSGPPLESTYWSWRPKCTRKRLARSFSRPFSTARSATAFSDQFDRICLRGPGGSRSKTPAEKHCFRPKSQRVNCCCCLRLRFPT